MNATTIEELTAKKCVPCEGGMSKYSLDEAKEQMASVPGWELEARGERISKHWIVKDFQAGIDFFHRIADLAEEEGHHPDLHLENYRQVRVELSTHAIGGLSQNDFILAAKIDQLPVRLRERR
jgi:4a-hydroxytetrahydrobiopterin dehydratase